MAAKLSDELALRIGVAAGCLPGVDVPQLIAVLADALGMPITASKLQRLTLSGLRRAKRGALGNTPGKYLAQSLSYLNGKTSIHLLETPAPSVESDCEDSMVNFLRVAVASDDGERLDGDFMTSKRFLIYQVSPTQLRLVAVRENSGGDSRNDRRQKRLQHIADCRLVYAKSISTPVSASLVAAGVHPVSVFKSMSARDALAGLQQTLEKHPPPWLSKAAGLPLRIPRQKQEVNLFSYSS